MNTPSTQNTQPGQNTQPVQRVTTLTPEQFRQHQHSPDFFIIDVRDEAEFAAGCEDNTCNWPLGSLSALRVADLVKQHGIRPDQTLVLLCARGLRARQAASQLHTLLPNPIAVVEGGRAALSPPDAGAPMSIERQVRIAAGSLVLLGVIGSWLVHPGFIGLSAFVGAGLVFAGVTDWCGMGLLIARMPWNRLR